MEEIVITALLFLLGLFFGARSERRHYKDLVKREASFLHFPTYSGHDASFQASEAQLVSGSVVIANDYFKNFVANLRSLFGGRLSSFESLMDRARREAMLRMKEKAIAWGAREIVHVRVESSTMDQLGVEIFAVGTALK